MTCSNVCCYPKISHVMSPYVVVGGGLAGGWGMYVLTYVSTDSRTCYSSSTRPYGIKGGKRGRALGAETTTDNQQQQDLSVSKPLDKNFALVNKNLEGTKVAPSKFSMSVHR